MNRAIRQTGLLAWRWRMMPARWHGQVDSSVVARMHLDALRRELAVFGVRSVIVMSSTWPRLYLGTRYVAYGADSNLFENHVLAARTGIAGWSYWWPWIQRIGPTADPAVAARIIADELGIDTGIAGLSAAGETDSQADASAMAVRHTA